MHVIRFLCILYAYLRVYVCVYVCIHMRALSEIGSRTLNKTDSTHGRVEKSHVCMYMWAHQYLSRIEFMNISSCAVIETQY